MMYEKEALLLVEETTTKKTHGLEKVVSAVSTFCSSSRTSSLP